MSSGNLHITPISPDPAASGRYGSSSDRAYRESGGEPRDEDTREDRLELSDAARRWHRERGGRTDMEIARQALEMLPDLPKRRRKQLEARIEAGYYVKPLVTRRIAARLAYA